VPVKSYAQLHQRLLGLIARGDKVADPAAGTLESEIHKWLNEAQYCLLYLENKIPASVLSDFQRLRESCEFTRQDDEDPPSKSAYCPTWTDPSTGVLVGGDLVRDFNFEDLKQINGILRLAATKLELDGYSFAEAEISSESLGATDKLPSTPAVTLAPLGNPSDEKLGEKLRAARRRSGHSQRKAGAVMGYDHKYICEWEKGKRKPHPDKEQDIRDYIDQYPEAK